MKQLLFILIAFLGVMAHGIERTTRRNLKVSPGAVAVETAAEYDTIAVDREADIRLSGFDKPLRSNYETLFITNNLGERLSGVVIELNYLDGEGRQLHKREICVGCDVPDSETRQIRFRSWDRQQSFYYRLSARPRRSTAVPFDVRCRVVAVVIKKN